MYQSLIENGISIARQELGEKEFATERQAGRSMPSKQTISYALEDWKP